MSSVYQPSDHKVPAITAFRWVSSSFGDRIAITATLSPGACEPTVDIQHNRVDRADLSIDIALTVSDAHRLAVALYEVIADVENAAVT